MKKKFVLVTLGAVVFLILSAFAAAKPEGKTWTGWISDSGCGAKGAKAEHKGCAITCVKQKGAKYVLVDSKTQAVVAINNQDAVKEDNIGMEVKLTGNEMEDKSIHVESIQPAG